MNLGTLASEALSESQFRSLSLLNVAFCTGLLSPAHLPCIGLVSPALLPRSPEAFSLVRD